MNADQLLAAMRENAAYLLSPGAQPGSDDYAAAATSLAAYAQDLDELLSRGGSKPGDWQ